MARRDTGNHTTYWQSKRIAGMSLLRADFTSHQFSPHTHDAFVIAVTEAGGAEISSRGIARKVGTTTLFVSNPEEGSALRGRGADRRHRRGRRTASGADTAQLPAINAAARDQ